MQKDEEKIAISEIFFSVQGEGPFSGYPAVFVRVAGCSIGCQWCDSRYAWNKEGAQIVTVQRVGEMITDRILEGRVQVLRDWMVVITGGEPSLCKPEVMKKLINFLYSGNCLDPKIHIETAGIRWINEFSLVDHVVVSPKEIWYKRHKDKYLSELEKYRDSLHMLNQVSWKFVISSKKDIEFVRMMDIELHLGNKVWIMPEGVTSAQVREKLPMVVDMAKKWGYKVSDRLQIMAYEKKRGV